MKQTNLRYDPGLIDPRVEALLPHVQADHEPVKITRSQLKIIALLKGLEWLERRHKLVTEE